MITSAEIRAAGGLAEWMRKEGRRSVRAKNAQQGASQGETRVSEHEEQRRLIEVCKLHESEYPELALLHAIPNGGQRHAAVAAKLKAEGVRSGMPDLFLPAPRGDAHGMYIELKAIGGRVTDNQRRMMDALRGQGYACLVCYGWEAAWTEIRAYLESKTVMLWPPAALGG